MKLIVKATVLEDGLIEQVENMAKRNEYLFKNETVALMADAHKTNSDLNTDSVPVGFTMTLSKGLIPVDYISADMYCGVSSYLIKGYTPTQRELTRLSTIARDVFQVNRRMLNVSTTDLGTLGNGNHFIEIGTDGKDTLLSVHSGSRNFGGDMFKKHKQIAIQHTRERSRPDLSSIKPQDRQAYLESLPKVSKLPLLDVNKYPEYFKEIEEARQYASDNRMHILQTLLINLEVSGKEDREFIETVHNFLDTSGEVPIVRKGSISAKDGEVVVVPIKMKDGIIMGVAKNTGDVNYSLPHGAGRILSRTQAFEELDLETFKNDMDSVVSPTVSQGTLDESPRAYKSLDVILKDIEPYLDDVRVFKTVFNYKGV